jgi:kumamolisin
MAKTKHKPLEGSHSEYFSKWDSRFKSKAPAKHKLEVKLIMKSDQHLDELDIPRDISLKKRQELFASHIGVHDEHIARIKKFARTYRLKIESEDKDMGIITMSGTVAAMNKAFHIDLHHHEIRERRTGKMVQALGYEGKVSVPEEIHDLVEGVLGLNCTPGAHQIPRDELITVCAARGVTSEWFADYYKFPKGFNGKGQHIAIISCGGGFNPKDFALYFKKAGLKNPPKIKLKSLDGEVAGVGVNLPADYELYTDCLVAACAAPEAQITVCIVENSIYGFAEGVEYLSKLKRNRPDAISYSWGASETNYAQTDINAVNRKLQYAALVSQMSIFCASGDFGSTNSSGQHASGKPKPSTLTVQYPASSPWITSCGGTMFELTITGRVRKEIAWNATYLYDWLIRNASGGGFSTKNKRPAFQKKAIPVKDYPKRFKSQRGVPDISAHANVSPDNMCYWVYMQGQNWVSGGTSAVAPLLAALVARLNEALDAKIGYFNPLLYDMADSKAIKSITEGNNSMPDGPDAWQASKQGWDPCTGLGVPNGEEMLKWLKKNLK